MEGDLGHTHDEDTEDWVSQTSAKYVALMAQRRGQIKDTGHTSDDEESTASDVESEDELTERDDNSRRPRTSRCIEGKATDITLAQPQENKGGSAKEMLEEEDSDNILRRSPRFHIGSTTSLP